MKKQIVSLIFLLFSAYPASAWSEKVVLEIGIHAGGDELVQVSFNTGDVSTIQAGALLSLNYGIAFDLSPDLEAQFTAGIKFDEVSAINGSVTFTRYPINFLVYYKHGDWNIGGGVTYHINPTLNGSGISSGLFASYENATGYIIDAMYFFERQSYIGFRYTNIDYRTLGSANTTSDPVDGNSFGLVFGARF